MAILPRLTSDSKSLYKNSSHQKGIQVGKSSERDRGREGEQSGERGREGDRDRQWEREGESRERRIRRRKEQRGWVSSSYMKTHKGQSDCVLKPSGERNPTPPSAAYARMHVAR